MGDWRCFFFSLQFGYSLHYIFREIRSDFWKSFKQMTNKIDITEFQHFELGDNKYDFTNHRGWIFPLTVTPETTIFDAHDASDFRQLMGMINSAGLRSKIKDLEKFRLYLMTKDWLVDGLPDEFGIERDDILALLEKYPTYKGFYYGFNNTEYGLYSSICVFKNDKLSRIITDTATFGARP